ncbi:transcription elongation factor GreB [Gammaproteobacteria bacterium LSUCC0057]|uniref:Transcription elongation factor GreB n=1 Tax=Gammaproteobacteria bacterium LSUCC0057 TaxID=2559237 RepID=A0A4Y8UID1_9GAMM|nr:transcription elongation factor GreB [Gammaproteobacteria bacterium LSUCC0057]
MSDTPQRKVYLTGEGAARLRDELRQLWKVERPQVTHAVQQAAKNGDRSENGDYIYGKRRLREIDRRVRYLDKRLQLATVVERPPRDTSRIYFGAWVTLQDQHSAERTVRIVGSDEIDTAQQWISIDSPVARALIGKAVDDEISVVTPSGTAHWAVVAIRYSGLS